MSKTLSKELPAGSKKHWPAASIAAGLVSVACLVPAHGAEAIGLSGYELFRGTSSGSVVRGVIFAGVTHAPCNCFTSDGDGGTWVASIDRTAGGGIGGGSVSILGGKLTVESAEVARTFRVRSGSVTWPQTLQQDIGCGPGVATFSASLNAGRSLTGCLDDTHLDPTAQPFVFPPKIWGTLQ